MSTTDNEIYEIQLILEPFCDDAPVKSNQVKQMMKNKDRVYEIIKSALFGFDILQWSIKDSAFCATIRANGKLNFGTSVEQHIQDTFGDGACDTWMEEDISIGKVKDVTGSEDYHYVELGLGLVSISLVDQ